MKSAVETLSPTRVKLTVEVPFEDLKPSLDAAYQQIAKQINVPGFRRGKVPPMVIDRQVGRGAVLEQAINETLPTKYTEALKANDLTPLAQPEIEGLEIGDDEGFSLHRRGRRQARDHRPRLRRPDRRGRRRRGHRRRRRRAGRGAARAVRDPQRRRAGGGRRRLRRPRPAGHQGRRGRRRRRGHRHVLQGRPRRHDRRPRRGPGRPVAPARTRPSRPSSSAATWSARRSRSASR